MRIRSFEQVTLKNVLSTAVVFSIFAVSIGTPLNALAQERGNPTPTSAAITVPDEAPPTGVNLSLTPTFLNLSTNPGEKVSSQFKITNNNNFREYLSLEVDKFVASPNGVNPVIQNMKESDNFAKWVSFSEDQFVVEPRETKTIKFEINPPKEAALGYYYAFVVNRMSDVQGKGSGAAIAGSPALPVLLSVKSPNARREVQVVDFKTDKLFYEYLPTKFIVRVKNTGNIHVAPAGDIFIDSMFSKNVGSLQANKARGNVLPQSEREFVATWSDAFAVKEAKTENGKQVTNDKGNVEYKVNYEFAKANKFRIGKYTAHLVMVYDSGDRDVPLEATVSFWVIPWKIVLIGGGVIILALVGIFSIVRSNIRKIRNKFQ
jgi:hypothetical protein